MNTNRAGTWVIRIVLLLFVLMVIYPIFFVLLTSLKSTSEFYKNIWLLPRQYAWGNYAYAWNIAKIGDYFLTSVIIVSITVVVTLLLSALAGYGLARLNVPFADTIVIVIFLLSMLPSESILMPSYLLISKLGFTGSYSSVIIPYISWGLPLSIYIYRNFFQTVPNEIIEAARIDGCSETGTFTKIVLPIVRPRRSRTRSSSSSAGGAKCSGRRSSCPRRSSRRCRWASRPSCRAPAPTGARSARPARSSSCR
jgi:raffinose/stachyose/melibiose transport system permease protein